MATWFRRPIASRSRGAGDARTGVAPRRGGCRGTSNSPDYPDGHRRSDPIGDRNPPSSIELLVVLGVALLAFALADAAARWPNFNPDESRWLSRAHYVAALAD